MKTHPKTLSMVEAEKLIEQLDYHTSTCASRRSAARNKLIGLLLLDAGLRVGELTKLKVQNLVYAGQPVTNLVMSKEITKRNIERTIPLSKRIQAAIAIYLYSYWLGSDGEICIWAFCGDCWSRHISTRQVERIIGNASISAFGKSIHPHILRHTFASRLMRITNIRVVQELLGHKNLQTTQVYTHPNTDDLENAIKGMSCAESEKNQTSLQNAEVNLANRS